MDPSVYKNHILHYKYCTTHTKSHYPSGLICSHEGNTKSLDSRPSHFYSANFCNSLMSFFIEKSQKIHQHLGPTSSPSISSELNQTSHSFSIFQLPTVSEISDLISKSKSSSFPQFWLKPASLLRAPSSLPSSTHHWNYSYILQDCCNYLKKKEQPSADPTNLNDTHPISNLPFISKILVKAAPLSFISHEPVWTVTVQFPPPPQHRDYPYKDHQWPPHHPHPPWPKCGLWYHLSHQPP